MSVINDLTNRIDRLAVAYGRHVVKGTLTKHFVETNQVTLQVALGLASLYNKGLSKFFCRGWDSIESLFYQGFTIDPGNYHFHSGGPADAPDAYFPGDIAHPKAAYYSARLPVGMSIDNQPDQMAGIFKTTKVADYNSSGVQVQSDGSAIPGGADPDDYLFYSANPALVIADMKRRTRRSLATINWPSWCAWRDYCKVLIPWDDGALTPHQVALTAAAGGSLAPATYWIRIATLKGGDISSASKDRATDGVTTASVVCSGGNLQFTAQWADQSLRGATGYRVYIGTAEGAEDRYFTVGSGATNTLTITTLSGATMGAPPAIATGALLRQIPRFESHVFFQPPFGFAAALDRIAQITCMDWQYAGGLLKFLTPEVRTPVFTVNLAECTGFKTYQTDRRQSFNQIVVSYRDLDDQYLAQADPPVEINRDSLQAKEGVRPFNIDIGCAYRSQAERVGSYWARRLIDSDQMIELEGSPRTYVVLPGDSINVTHNVPDWTDVQFYIESKEEPEDTKAGYPMTGRIGGAWYSDTDSTPLPRPLPDARLNPFIAPPVVTSVALALDGRTQPDGTYIPLISGGVTFAAFVGQQRGRVWWRNPTDEKVFTVDPSTDIFTAIAHLFTNGMAVGVRNSGGGLPAPLTNTTTCFVVNKTTDTFQLAATAGGAPLNITSTGTGTNYVAQFKQVLGALTPDQTTLQAAFELLGISTGIHQIKVVSESFLGVSLPFEQQPVFSLTVAVLSTVLRIAEPVLIRSSDVGLGWLAAVFAGAGSGLWKGTQIWRDRLLGSGYEPVAALTSPAIGGVSTNTLATVAETTLFDAVSTVRVTFDGGSVPPANCSLEDALAGLNKIMIGNYRADGYGYEIVNATTFTLVSGSTYDVTGFWRGRGGTEFAVGYHAAGDVFLVVNDALKFIPAVLEDVGRAVNLKAVSFGEDIANIGAQAFTLQGNSEKPLSVVQIESYRDSAGNMGLTCTPRTNFEIIGDNYFAEFLSDDGATVLLAMLFKENIEQAALLLPGKTVKNNISSTAGHTYRTRSLQTIQATGNIVEATLDCPDFYSDHASMGLATLNQWQDGSLIAADYRVDYNWSQTFGLQLQVKVGGTAIYTAPWYTVDHASVRVKIALVGSSVRFYRDGLSLPFAQSAVQPNFPYYAFAEVAEIANVKDVMLTTNPFPSTILSAAQQALYLSSIASLNAIRTRIRQHSGIDKIGYGFPTEGVL